MNVDPFNSLKSYLDTHHLFPGSSRSEPKLDTQKLVRQFADIHADKASIDKALVELAEFQQELHAVYQELSTLKDNGVSPEAASFKAAEKNATDLEFEIRGRMQKIEEAQQKMGTASAG